MEIRKVPLPGGKTRAIRWHCQTSTGSGRFTRNKGGTKPDFLIFFVIGREL